MAFDYISEANSQHDAFFSLEAVLLLPKPLEDIQLEFISGPLNNAVWVIELLIKTYSWHRRCHNCYFILRLYFYYPVVKEMPMLKSLTTSARHYSKTQCLEKEQCNEWWLMLNIWLSEKSGLDAECFFISSSTLTPNEAKNVRI